MGRVSVANQANRAELLKARQAAFEAMTPALRAAATKLGNMGENQRKTTLQFYYNLGGILVSIAEQPDKYGENARELLLQAYPTTARTLRDAMTFRQAYPDGIDDLLLQEDNAGFAIQWAHARLLSSLDTPAQRASWLKRVRTNVWTPKELSAALKASRAGARGGGHGRGFATADTFNAQVLQTTEHATRFTSRITKSWLSEKDGIVAKFETLEYNEICDGRAHLAAAVIAVQELSGRVDMFLQQLLSIQKAADRVSSAGAPPEDDDADDADDDMDADGDIDDDADDDADNIDGEEHVIESNTDDTVMDYNDNDGDDPSLAAVAAVAATASRFR